MVNNSKAFQVAKYAVMMATIFVAMMLDRVISLGLPISTAACVLLVTFSFCYLDNTWLTGIIVGALFGFVSFLKEFIFPSSVAAFPVYVWPLITILPRVAMGAAAFSVYRLMLLITKKMGNAYARQTLSMTVATLIGNAVNTVLFLLALNVCKIVAHMDYTSLLIVIKGVILTNILPEYLISMILAPHIVLGVRRGLKLGVDGNNLKRLAEQEKLENSEQLVADGDAQTPEQRDESAEQNNEVVAQSQTSEVDTGGADSSKEKSDCVSNDATRIK